VRPPRRDAPDASRSRQAPARTSGGTVYPTRRSGLWRIPNSIGWIGSLAGALARWKICLFQPTRRRRPDSHPRIAPGRSPNAPFGQQAARGPTRRLSDPPHCAGKRADRPEGKSSRKTPDPHPDRLPHERTRTGGGRRRTIGAPCGRQSPADYTSGSGDPRFREAPLDAPKSSQRNQSTRQSDAYAYHGYLERTRSRSQ
jgi:hypothetical protein